MGKDGPHNNLLERILFTLNEDSEANKKHSAFNELSKEINEFLNEVPGGFLIYRADGNEDIIYANNALVRIMGCEDLADFRRYTGNSFKGLVHPDDLELIEKSIVNQISTSHFDLDYVEYRIKRKDGEIRWIEDYGHFVRNETMGDIFYVFLTDATEKIERQLIEKGDLISQRNENEKKIKTLIEEYDNERKIISKEQLRRLEVIEGLSINYESILYVDLDADMVVPYRVSIRTKAQFDKELHVSTYSSFVKDYIKTWVHPEDKKKVKENFSKVTILKRLAEDRTYYLNYRCVYYGTVQNMQLRISCVGESLTQVVVGFRNIDEEMRREMQNKQVLDDALDKARAASAVKNAFLSNMSHDMRTPLNAIFGYVNLARKNIDNTSQVAQYLDKIETAGQQILELTEKVLTMTYAESQNAVVETECSLSEIIHSVYDAHYHHAIRKGIEFTTDCEHIANDKVITDGDKLKQILSQLTDNAIKYTKTGGKVSLKVLECGKSPNGTTSFKFVVEDTGVGIDKEVQKHIFAPFERVGNTTASGVFGTGLGLTIVKNLTETLDGTVELKSAIGKGSTFTVTLSFHIDEEIDTAFDKDEVFDQIKRGKILIVEDNEINLDLETEILEELGFSVESAENGKIAVDKIDASPDNYYSLVLMDIQMPVMDGRQAAEAIRKLANPAHASLPIIALSANAFERDKRLSMQSGMDAHLAKPMDVDKLLFTMLNIQYKRQKGAGA